jgi:hypothetical protein
MHSNVMLCFMVPALQDPPLRSSILNYSFATGGGAETDAFKHLAAAFTVLRSLGSAKTAANRESSRIVSYANHET